jgi:hypothetical protein
VLPLVALQRIPEAPRGVAGLFNYRGEPVVAVDLCELILGRPARPALSTRILVVNTAPAASRATAPGIDRRTRHRNSALRAAGAGRAGPTPGRAVSGADSDGCAGNDSVAPTGASAPGNARRGVDTPNRGAAPAGFGGPARALRTYSADGNAPVICFNPTPRVARATASSCASGPVRWRVRWMCRRLLPGASAAAGEEVSSS